MTVSGGAMVPPELVRRVREAFGCGFETVYGQTESSPVVTQTAADDSLQDLCETVGRALPQTEISIRDPASNALVPVGQVGEICARGYCVMLGYNDNPEATGKAIDAEGWLHTGDLGTMDARGYLRVTGRVKEMIIRGGENLFPAEIENILLEHRGRGGGRRGGRAGRALGRGGGLLRAPGARRGARPGGAENPLPRQPRAAEDAGALDRGDRVAADRLGQDPEVRAARPLRGRRVRRRAGGWVSERAEPAGSSQTIGVIPAGAAKPRRAGIYFAPALAADPG